MKYVVVTKIHSYWSLQVFDAEMQAGLVNLIKAVDLIWIVDSSSGTRSKAIGSHHFVGTGEAEVVAPEFLRMKADVSGPALLSEQWEERGSRQSSLGSSATGGLSTASRNGGGLQAMTRFLCQQAVNECRPLLTLVQFEKTAFKKVRYFFRSIRHSCPPKTDSESVNQKDIAKVLAGG